jgi:acyl carrier protein
MIDDELRAIVAEVAEVDAASIDPDLSLSEAGIDSLMAMEITVDVERQYGLHFADEELQQIVTFAALARLTREKLAAGEGISSAS